MAGPLMLEKLPPLADEKCCRRNIEPEKCVPRGSDVRLTARKTRFPIVSTHSPPKSGDFCATALLPSIAIKRMSRKGLIDLPKRTMRRIINCAHCVATIGQNELKAAIYRCSHRAGRDSRGAHDHHCGRGGP